MGEQGEFQRDSRVKLADELLPIVEQLAAELHPGSAPRANLNSSLERDLGLDSLARVELLSRIERRFGLRFSGDALAKVESVRDVIDALGRAGSVQAAPVTTAPLAAPDRAEGVPSSARNLVEALDWQVEAHPERQHVLFYRTENETESLAYSGLRNEALAIAAGLKDHGLESGQAVAIMLPTCLEFFQCF